MFCISMKWNKDLHVVTTSWQSDIHKYTQKSQHTLMIVPYYRCCPWLAHNHINCLHMIIVTYNTCQMFTSNETKISLWRFFLGNHFHIRTKRSYLAFHRFESEIQRETLHHEWIRKRFMSFIIACKLSRSIVFMETTLNVRWQLTLFEFDDRLDD